MKVKVTVNVTAASKVKSKSETDHGSGHESESGNKDGGKNRSQSESRSRKSKGLLSPSSKRLPVGVKKRIHRNHQRNVTTARMTCRADVKAREKIKANVGVT